jgi:hypothetical protein
MLLLIIEFRWRRIRPGGAELIVQKMNHGDEMGWGLGFSWEKLEGVGVGVGGGGGGRGGGGGGEGEEMMY